MTRTTATIATTLLLVALAAERHLAIKRLQRHHQRHKAHNAAHAFALGVKSHAEGYVKP